MSRSRRLPQFVRRIGLAFVVLLAGAVASPLSAQPSSQWAGEGRDEFLKAAAVEALKKTMPGAEFAFNVADWGVDPLVTAATTPGSSEQKIDAWVRALGQAGVNAAFPSYGFVLAGGKIVIGSATYTVESMIQTTHDAQIVAILEGRGAGGPLDRVNNVLADTPFVSVLKADVSLDNIGYLTRTELDRKWEFYVTRVRDIHGRANAEVVKTEVWPKLLAMWETQRAKTNLERVVGQLDRALAEAQVQAEAKRALQGPGKSEFSGDLSGTWSWTCCGSGYIGTLTLVQNGDRLTGSFADGTVISGYVGASIAFSRTNADGSGGRQDFWVSAAADGKSISGTFSGDRNTSLGNDFHATRTSSSAASTATAAMPEGPGYYVFNLKDIGLVAATVDEVRTRPGCQWAGGGPPPCTTPAIVVGTMGGPYDTVDAARADMKTKLDCISGHWGTFLPMGEGRAWLQNNIGGNDCRTLKQI